MLNVPTDWWRNFFADAFVDMWLQAVPEEHTQKEIVFIRKMLQVEPPARLLDVPCGGGRHTLPLAAAGYRVTAVDISADFLNAARARSAELRLNATWVQQSMDELTWHAEFDGAFCFGNAFGYLDDEGNAAFLRAVWRSLQPGARFVLDYPMVLEARIPKFQEHNWWQVGDILFLEDEHYDHVTGRLLTEYTILRDGQVVKRSAAHRMYTYREVCRLLAEAGFVDVQAFSSLQQEPFQRGSDALFLVGTKPRG